MIVSRGKLLINSDLSLPPSRVAALLAHEVGTHLLTYYNGRMQPFQQLYSGLAGYEELQEGLAVLSEYLVGGLTRGRVRQLAARVVAVRHLTDGASFVETFRTLSRDYGFADRTAYNIAMRVYRGGGLTKDAVYLRGLVAILSYMQERRRLESAVGRQDGGRAHPDHQGTSISKGPSGRPDHATISAGSRIALQRLEALRGSNMISG